MTISDVKRSVGNQTNFSVERIDKATNTLSPDKISIATQYELESKNSLSIDCCSSPIIFPDPESPHESLEDCLSQKEDCLNNTYTIERDSDKSLFDDTPETQPGSMKSDDLENKEMTASDCKENNISNESKKMLQTNNYSFERNNYGENVSKDSLSQIVPDNVSNSSSVQDLAKDEDIIINSNELVKCSPQVCQRLSNTRENAISEKEDSSASLKDSISCNQEDTQEESPIKNDDEFSSLDPSNSSQNSQNSKNMQTNNEKLYEKTFPESPVKGNRMANFDRKETTDEKTNDSHSNCISDGTESAIDTGQKLVIENENLTSLKDGMDKFFFEMDNSLYNKEQSDKQCPIKIEENNASSLPKNEKTFDEISDEPVIFLNTQDVINLDVETPKNASEIVINDVVSKFRLNTALIDLTKDSDNDSQISEKNSSNFLEKSKVRDLL